MTPECHKKSEYYGQGQRLLLSYCIRTPPPPRHLHSRSLSFRAMSLKTVFPIDISYSFHGRI